MLAESYDTKTLNRICPWCDGLLTVIRDGFRCLHCSRETTQHADVPKAGRVRIWVNVKDDEGTI